VTFDPNTSLRRNLRTIFNEGTLAGLSDGQLLEQFVSRRGREAEPAFTLLIERHGPMVFRVCRSVLHDLHAADDAFQATFLILLNEAGRVRKRESIGPWLHGVAQRVATCAQSAAARRRAHEQRWFERRSHEAPTASAVDQQDLDLSATIHAELERLPERYRTPIVLCDLEACSLEEAARQLGWPLGTVKSRLSRGRQQLRDRLLRRGLAPRLAVVTLSDLGLTDPADAAISPTLLEATSQTLTTAVTGADVVSTSATILAQKVLKAMFMGKLKVAVASLVVVGLAALGIGALASSGPRVVPTERQTKADAIKTVQRTEKAAGNAKDQSGSLAKPSSPRDDRPQIETVTISGRAYDSTGQPVAGATIYIINANRRRPSGESPLLSTAITSMDGRFGARGVKVPIWKSDPSLVLAAEEGRFQIAGTASGFGFTWHEVSSYRPTLRRPADEIKHSANTAEPFYQAEPIQCDLVFGPAASLHGKIKDNLGHPLGGVKVQVGVCDDPRKPGSGKTWSCARVDMTETVPRARRAFDGIHSLPEMVLSTRTNLDGTYRIDGLPREAEFLTLIDPGPEFDPMQQSIATSRKGIEGVRSLGFDAKMDHTFVTAREVRVTVRYADTNQPARNATVRAKSNRVILRAGSVGTTDDNGEVALHLRPGDYDFVIEPALGATYRPLQGALKIGTQKIAEILVLTLEPATLAILEAFDGKTGAGIEGVRFQYETDTTRARQPLHSQLVFVDHPATGERRQLRVTVEPGRRRFFVDTVPRGWRFEGSPSELLDIAAGREHAVRFAFTKVEDPASKLPAKADSALFPDDLIEKVFVARDERHGFQRTRSRRLQQ
jgi:RNA polymerase sigma factor (sigma-70 family)